MPTPTCVKCGNSTFVLEYLTPKGARFKYSAIVCSSCGGVAGLAEFYNIGEQIVQQNKAIKSIASKIGVSVDLLTET